MNNDDSVFVAGHRGLAGSAILRVLQTAGHRNVITRSRAELDLRRQEPVERFFETTRPAYVVLAAGTVGGILANNTYRADFIRDNLQIQTNIIDAAHRSGRSLSSRARSRRPTSRTPSPRLPASAWSRPIGSSTGCEASA